jgi:peptide-methionine (S)-S-oxide reductase
MEKATFAAGCFWGVEEKFRAVSGVRSSTRASLTTFAGYTGGHWPNPCYLDVCARITGHAEAVLIEYDRSQVSYEALLDIFWNCHDPTQINRQGPDRGEQYRSVIFYHTSEQEKAAHESKQKLQISGKYDKDIATEIQPAGEFYLAEDYHQQYIEKKQQRESQERSI